MKRRDLIVYSILFLVCIGITSEIVTFQLTGNHIFSTNATVAIENKDTAVCSDDAMKERPTTSDPQLKVIAEYEKVCGSAFLDDMMIFTNMPISDPNANAAADMMTARLKDFDKQHITPIVIMEPDSDWGLVDFHEYATGYYDDWMTTYFMRLKSNGITDAMMGLWIPFPEPQQPTWNNSSPDDFAYSVNRYFKTLRQAFPAGKTGILLDSQVGVSDKASQLLAYTRLIDNSLVDVAGLQGFPWHPPDDDKRSEITSADEFAPAYLLEEVAKSLDTRDVLLNVGSYRHRKADNGGDIAITTSERRATLNSIVYETSLLRKQNYNVTVNVFAENKFDTKEGVDWSYWITADDESSEQTLLFTSFVHHLKENGSVIGLYDSRP
ncbi:MAG TPA: hypothetical protein VK497_06030 [Candidatus Saccharimonadales bacterium]|nr:hypothetical protein [Candidatus Saccharimonadales bacterium]